MWSSEPREGPAARRAKEVPSFLSYFKTLSIGLAPGIEPVTSHSAVKRSTDWANPAAVKCIFFNVFSYYDLLNLSPATGILNENPWLYEVTVQGQPCAWHVSIYSRILSYQMDTGNNTTF